MNPEEMAPKQFAESLARMVDCPDGETFLRWLDSVVAEDSYDPINPHNTSRNEGYRAMGRMILGFVKRGRSPKSYPERSES